MVHNWSWRQAVVAWACAGKVGKLLSTLELHARMATVGCGDDLATGDGTAPDAISARFLGGCVGLVEAVCCKAS